jgi:hypothetical protein
VRAVGKVLALVLACGHAHAATHTVGPPSAGACGGSDCDYNSVQAAIDAAAAADTITVYRRTDDAANNECYDEHVMIAKANLTIQGDSTTPASAACIGPSTGGDIVSISVSGVTLKNLHISGKANDGAGGTNAKAQGGRSAGHGVVVRGADLDGVTVQNCTIDFNAHDNIRFDGDTDGDGDGYIVIKQCYLHHADSMRNIRIIGGGGSASDHHIIRNNLVHTGQGVLLSGSIDYATVEKNVIKGWPYWGHLDGGSYPEVRTGSFGGGYRYYSNCIAGVWATATAPSDLLIQNNLILATRWGIRVNTDGTVRNNTIVNPFNASQYDFDGTIAASDIRDHTFGIMVADGFDGTIQNNVVVVTSDNRANGSPGQSSGTYYTPGITGYGIGFLNNTGTLGGSASVANNLAWGFVDTDGTTALNYGSGITAGATNLSEDPQFATDTGDETNGGSDPCLADGNDAGDTRCYELYEDNYFLGTERASGSCHASVLENTAGAPEFVDLSAGGTRDPDSDDHSGLDDCSTAADSANSRAIDFGSGAVGSEPEKNGDLINLGAFGGTDRASKSPTLRVVSLDVGDGGVKAGDTTFSGPGLVQARSAGLTTLNLYFNRAFTAASNSFLIRDLCDGADLAALTLDTTGAYAAPFKAVLTWTSGTLTDQAVRVHALGDGVNRIVDNEDVEALDGEISDLIAGTLPSGNNTVGGDAEFAVFALTGDVDGDRFVEGKASEDDYTAITGYSGYPSGSCTNCPEDIDADGDVDATDLASVTGNDNVVSNSGLAATFTDIGTGSGLSTSSLHSMAFADFNNDGYVDMAKGATSPSGSRSISINDGDNTFTTSSVALPVGYRGIGWGDYDNDGDIDLVGRDPSNSDSPGVIRNDGAADGLSWTQFLQSGNNNEATMFADIDGDGDLDVWNMGDDDVWNRNDGTTSFVALNAMPGLANDDMPNGEGCTSADFTGDGYPDFMWNDANGSGSTQAWTNDGDFTYTNHENVNTDFGLPEAVGAHEDMEWAWGDYDNDGDLDVFISGPSGVGLYDNNGSGVFTDVSTAAGVTITATTHGADWGDYDNDGDLDLVVSKGGSATVYSNDGDSTFTDDTVTSLITTLGNVIGWLDIDNDGDLDLMSGEGDLWRNDLDDCHYLRVIATGSGTVSGSAKTPIGARIKVFQAGTSNLLAMREIAAGFNNLQPAPIQHFGLDPATAYDIEVFFPASGTTVTQASVRPDEESHTIGAATLSNTIEVLETTGWTTLFNDDFTRADSTTVGNSWTETEGAAADAQILSNRLDFNPTDVADEPIVSHTFTKQTTGKVHWTFTFNMERTAGEDTYEVRMQLGDSAALVSPATSDNTGVAVNLIWGGTSNGLTNHEGIGYDDSGTVTEVAVVSGDAGTNSGGDATVTVVADLDADTFDLFVTGPGLVSGAGTAKAVAFDNAVDIDTVRIYFDLLNQANFGDLEVDDLRIEHDP